MVDSVVSSRETYGDYAGDIACFKAIFDVLGEVQHLGSTRFAGAEASLLWYKEMFDNGRQAIQYQALVQFVEVTQKGNWSEYNVFTSCHCHSLASRSQQGFL